MKEKVKNKLIDIKDWFVIQGIRLSNFIKEHKYISSALGLFIVVGIVGLIWMGVKALSQNPNDYNLIVYSSKSQNPIEHAPENFEYKDVEYVLSNPIGESTTDVYSYSTITYTIPYILTCSTLQNGCKEGDIIDAYVEALVAPEEGSEIDSNQINWTTYSNNMAEDTSYDASSVRQGAIGQRFELSDVMVGKSNTLSLDLNIKNIQEGNKFKVIFYIYYVEKYKEDKSQQPKDYISDSPFVVKNDSSKKISFDWSSGYAYKENDDHVDYKVPFGLKLSIPGPSIAGFYYDSTSNINQIIKAVQNGNTIPIEMVGLFNDVSDHFPKNTDLFNSYEQNADTIDMQVEAEEIDENIKLLSLHDLDINDSNFDSNGNLLIGSYYILASTNNEENITLMDYDNNELAKYSFGKNESSETKNEELTSTFNDSKLTYAEEGIITYLYESYEFSENKEVEINFENSGLTITDNILNNSESSANICYYDKDSNECETDIENVNEISKISITFSNINQGDTYEFEIHVKAKEEKGNYSISAGNESIYYEIVPFKNQTKLAIDDSEEENVEVGSKSTISIYPYFFMQKGVTSSSENLTNGITKINITLPEGMNYIGNLDNNSPTIDDDKLTYVINNLKTNSWIDPIKILVSYDLEKENEDLELVVNMVSEFDDEEDDSTITRTITYVDNNDVKTQIIPSKLNIDEDEDFYITLNFNNTLEESKDYMLKMPDNKNYSYTIDNAEDMQAACYTETDNAQSEGAVCDFESNPNYNYIKFEVTQGTSSYKINITPTGSSGEKYEFVGYLKDDEDKKDTVTVYINNKRITGTVWEEINGNNIMDSSEKKIEGVKIGLYDEDGNSVDETYTDENGIYEFTSFNVGDYYLVLEEYNAAKYTVTPRINTVDRSISSSFEKQDERVKTDIISVPSSNIVISDYNLGLSLKQTFSVKLNKYISKAITTNALGIKTTKDFGNVSFAKLDVRDINNLTIKVIYTIEIENTGYYPGYINEIKDYVPDGMEFDENDKENSGWSLNENGILINTSLSDTLIEAGSKKYLTVSFNVTRKEAGSFINTANIDDNALEILGGRGNE